MRPLVILCRTTRKMASLPNSGPNPNPNPNPNPPFTATGTLIQTSNPITTVTSEWNPNTNLNLNPRLELHLKKNKPNVIKAAPFGTHSARSLHGDWRYKEANLLHGDRTPHGSLKTPKASGTVGGLT